jgi:hypothetical protein
MYLRQQAIRELDLTDEQKLRLIRKLKVDLKDATLGNRCGRCGAEGEHGRVNYERSPRTLSTYSGRSIDQHEDFSDWSMQKLKDRVDLVTAFDAACDEIRDNFIGLLDECTPVEKTIMVPKKVTVRERRESA